MSRFERKKRNDINLIENGNILDFFDNEIKSFWFINDEEYDFICSHSTDDELNLLIIDNNSKGGGITFTIKKRALLIVDKLIDKMYNTINSNKP